MQKRTAINNTLEAIARRYLARKAPDVRAHSLPLFLVRALRAASTATSISSAVAAGISPVTVMLASRKGLQTGVSGYEWTSPLQINGISLYNDDNEDNNKVILLLQSLLLLQNNDYLRTSCTM